MTEEPSNIRSSTVASMREASPYIRLHRGETFVVYFDGEQMNGAVLDRLAQDLILLRGLGVKLVVVHGARDQINSRLRGSNIQQEFVGNLRITRTEALPHVKDAVSSVRIELEARLTQAALDVASRGNALTVAGGNFVIARPAGIVNGVDLHFTGIVRRIDRAAIERRLNDGEIVLISPLGYSPTGEVFNLNSLDLATAVATELIAAKMILMMESPGVVDGDNIVVRELNVRDAREFVAADQAGRLFLDCAIRACQFGVNRVHLVDQTVDGVLLAELFTRDGVGTLVSNTPFEQFRLATIEDVGGVLALIEPLEQEGFLVKRSREKLEIEISHFSVLVREDTVIACGALYPFPNAIGELACVAVHPDYRRYGFGNIVLQALERRARDAGLEEVFVLTTHASHWFLQNGFLRSEIQELPIERQALYNLSRNSLVLRKRL
ncbi:MAG: amino-acid N-acetyltransferase [Gammaproteobacteria bacterium]|jgi:amino-acid N-acetyltransferase